PVERLGAIGSREVVQPALELGLVDIVPEYAGTMLSFVSLGENEPTFDSDATVHELRAELGPRGMIVLDAANAQNKNVVIVTRALAAEHDLREMSDLEAIAGTLTFGGPVECPERRFCLVGMRDVYGLEFDDFVPLPSSAVVADGLLMGEIDVGLVFTTDAAMVDSNLTGLLDDRNMQPAENVVPVVRWDVYMRYAPDLGAVLNEVSSRLDTSDLALLNLQSTDPRADLGELARLWLASP
ncbi:MAG: ABC transporter substrate-binding protein, partial [Ilumatobacteraceae bacterium]